MLAASADDRLHRLRIQAADLVAHLQTVDDVLQITMKLNYYSFFNN